MRLLRGLKTSLATLAAHKLRTGLALASVAAGVAGVVLTAAIGAGTRREALKQTENMGMNLIVVRPAQVKVSTVRRQVSGVATSLKPEDVAAISRLGPVAEAIPGFESSLRIKAGSNTTSALVLGTLAPYLSINRLRVRDGRFFDEEDDRASRRVAVLGARVSGNLFDMDNPVGREIRIRGIPFEVIGVLEAKGVMADGSDLDNQVLIPIRTALRRVFNSTWLNPVFVSARDASDLEPAEAQIAELLKARHRLQERAKSDDFTVQDKVRVLGAQKKIAESLAQLSLGLAAVSVLIGGAGILAVMLMSVKERTGEIGLRMAIGARPSDILAQFLFEATALALGGWVCGLSIGAMLSAAVAFSTAWKISISADLVFVTLGLVTATGLLFGAYPARKASLMPPIQALLVK